MERKRWQNLEAIPQRRGILRRSTGRDRVVIFWHDKEVTRDRVGPEEGKRRLHARRLSHRICQGLLHSGPLSPRITHRKAQG